MQNKDFGFFQQHIEKIALGVGGLVLLGVGATQFLLGQPNAITLENQPVAPDEIQEAVVRPAKQLEGKLKGGSPIDDIDIPAYAELFNKHVALPVATDQPLAAIDNTGLAKPLKQIVSPDYPLKFLPTPPMPYDVLAKSGHGVLSENGGDRFFALQQIIGDQRPADFSYVSVSANFSFAELMKRYRGPDVPGEQRIDEGLWRERLAVTAVQLLREELDPATGEWGNPATIRPLPGQFAIVPDDQPTLTFEASQELETQIRANQPVIRRPDFPAISNGPWTPPDIANRVYTPEELQQREELQRRITQLERQLDRLAGDDRNPRGNDRNNRRGNQDDFDFQDFEEPRGARDRRDNRGSRDDTGTTDRRADRNAERLADLEDQLAAAQQELNELLGIEEDPNEFAGPRDFDGGDFRDPPRDFNPTFDRNNFDDGQPRRPGMGGATAGSVPDEIKVWAHDLTAKPGRTYRYKVLVSVMNPLYRFPRLNPKQLAENRNRISIGPSEEEISQTEWSPSATVELDPKHYYFVTGGSKDQKRADVEVWTVYDGIWRKNEFVEYPGNEIGGTAEISGVATGGRGVPMNVGTFMLDVDSALASNGRPDVRVLFIDPETNRITIRMVNDDKNSDKRKELELLADLQTKQSQNQLSDSR
ncbi:MAG: hypothetical protein AAF086_03825 [Planctomycetota bacterium]